MGDYSLESECTLDFLSMIKIFLYITPAFKFNGKSVYRYYKRVRPIATS